jgi:hypothetical protein
MCLRLSVIGCYTRNIARLRSQQEAHWAKQCHNHALFVLTVLQAAWHPGSSSHFAVLASDNRWRLYHTGKLTEAEQTFWLRLPGAQVCAVTGGAAQRFAS